MSSCYPASVFPRSCVSSTIKCKQLMSDWNNKAFKNMPCVNIAQYDYDLQLNACHEKGVGIPKFTSL